MVELGALMFFHSPSKLLCFLQFSFVPITMITSYLICLCFINVTIGWSLVIFLRVNTISAQTLRNWLANFLF